MKTLLEFRIDRLEAQTGCPCCAEGRDDFARNPAFFPESEDGDYLFAQDMQASAKFFCGSEFSVDHHGNIVANQPCFQGAIDKADEMQEAADEHFADAEDQDDAA